MAAWGSPTSSFKYQLQAPTPRLPSSSLPPFLALHPSLASLSSVCLPFSAHSLGASGTRPSALDAALRRSLNVQYPISNIQYPILSNIQYPIPNANRQDARFFPRSLFVFLLAYCISLRLSSAPAFVFRLPASLSPRLGGSGAWSRLSPGPTRVSTGSTARVSTVSTGQHSCSRQGSTSALDSVSVRAALLRARVRRLLLAHRDEQ
ncbi:hypothetical protein B0H15DRAFT_1023007 [Mycena belliarum]|uniref:Uncharacterized protein n=1 Tax=Mycena belliarum TaxID=1033014 RepID=A0AAD6XTK7_9AGAR|nr:hypothetical protein B0H15DRAFT_1023007 [Mycena belliae]